MPNYIRSLSDTESRESLKILEVTASSLLFSFFGTLSVIWYGGRIVHNGLDFWFLNLLTNSLPVEQLINIEDSLFNSSLFLQNTTLNGVLFFIFWIFVGVLVYEIIQGVLYFFFEIQEETHFITYERPGNQHHVPSLIWATVQKAILRFVFAISVIAYLFVCLKIVWPSLLSLFISKLSTQTNILDVLLLLVSLICILVTFHGLTVVSRLLTMRSRLF